MSIQPSNQRGFAHVLLLVGLVVVFGVIGFTGYSVMQKGKDSESSATGLLKAVAEAKCTDADKTICKFQASWKSQDYYTVVSTSVAEGKTDKYTYMVEGDKKFHMISSGTAAYELISIDDTTYTKASNGTWWKQTAKKADTPKPQDEINTGVTRDDSPAEKVEASKTTYKALGKEACGKLECYKYQVVDSANTESTEYIWFDTKDYQLRRSRSELKDGAVSEQTFSYDKFSIGVPSPVKELGPNQYLLPGEAEPTTLPSAADMQMDINSEQ